MSWLGYIRFKGCGDGICDTYGKETNGCPEDCRPGSIERIEKVPQEEMVEKGEEVSKELGIRPKGFFTKVFDWFLNLLGLERESESGFGERSNGGI